MTTTPNPSPPADVAELVDYLRRAAAAVHIAMDEPAAADLSPRLTAAASEIERLDARVAELEEIVVTDAHDLDYMREHLQVVVRSRVGIAVPEPPVAPTPGPETHAAPISPWRKNSAARQERFESALPVAPAPTAETHPKLFDVPPPPEWVGGTFSVPEPTIETEPWTPEWTEPGVDSASPPVTTPERATPEDGFLLITTRAEHGSTAVHCAACGVVDVFTPRVRARLALTQLLDGASHGWPWDPSWWKLSDDPIRNFVKAGALIAAEIDRLQRREEASHGG